MTTYSVTLDDGQSFLMQADMVHPEADIRASFDDGETWEPMPYQTFNANHDSRQAATLAASYFKCSDDDSATVAIVAEIA